MIRPASYSYRQDVGPVEVRTRPLPGPFAVGVCHYHAVDEARVDEQDHVPRQFMVSAFYPAGTQEGTVNARLVDLFEPEVGKAVDYLTDGLDGDVCDERLRQLRSIGLRSTRDALPARSAAPYPTLIYYPPGGCNRFANVDICEALASHGYVVLAVDGPHDAPLVVFPDGHFCKGPLVGDYISPGVGDVGYLLSQLDKLNGAGVLGGMIDAKRVGIFGHSRGGYIANIAAFQNERVKAAVSMDSFLWGYMSEGTGLEKHPPDFQAKVRSTAKPMLRLCGRPADTDPQAEAEFCLKRDGGDFVGDFSVVAFPGWSHGDFTTTPWSSGKGPELVANQSRIRTGAAETLTDILTLFFDIHLTGVDPGQLDDYIRLHPTLGVATQATQK